MSRRALAGTLLAVSLAGACARSDTAEGPRADADARAAILRFWRHAEQATALRTKGDCHGAISAYERALSIEPRHEDSLYYLGQCHAERGAPREARAAFERLVEANPESARGHLALGTLLASPEPDLALDLAAAERHFRRAHEINGEETGPMVRLAEVLIVSGRTREAEEWLGAAARTNPKSVEALFLLGYLRWESDDGAGARTFYDRAVDAAQPDVPIRGVLNEGDRRAAAPGGGAAGRAAPPLTRPEGRGLFGAFGAALRGAAVSGERAPEPDALFRAARSARRGLARRAGGVRSNGEIEVGADRFARTQ